MEHVTYILFGSTLLPVYSTETSEYIMLEDLPASLVAPVRYWLEAQVAVELGAEQLPLYAISKFRLTVFLIEHNLSDLLS